MSNFMSNENAQAVLNGYAEAIKNKQTKELSSPIAVGGVEQTTVEDCLTAIKNAIEPAVEISGT